MTGEEWLACTDPKAMLRFLRGKTSARKLRLFAVGCCRRIWQDLKLKPTRQAVEAVELYADGLVNGTELERAHNEGISAFAGLLDRKLAKKFNDAAYQIKMQRMGLAVDIAHGPRFHARVLIDLLYEDEFLREVSPDLLRCVVGNPLRKTKSKQAWLTSTVTALANAIYDARAFDRLPILADALEDAGCTKADVLSHCRQPGEHCRGCWVVDLLLGKE